MARVSKKVSAAQREAENAQHRIWKRGNLHRSQNFCLSLLAEMASEAKM